MKKIIITNILRKKKSFSLAIFSKNSYQLEFTELCPFCVAYLLSRSLVYLSFVLVQLSGILKLHLSLSDFF